MENKVSVINWHVW